MNWADEFDSHAELRD